MLTSIDRAVEPDGPLPSTAWTATTRRLLPVRVLRSIGQGALIVTFALYLRDLGWSGQAIGLLLTAGGLLNATASLVVGMMADRLGSKPFLLAYELIVFC